ncbi:MAG: 50S ribosomal protein P1 [Candidatus Bathyarchaeia archaeon]
MKYVYAALLLHSAKQQITEENIKKVISAAGIEVDEARVKALVSALSEINIDEALKAAPVAVAPVAAAAPAPQAQAPKEAAKEKEKEEEKKEALEGLSALFG